MKSIKILLGIFGVAAALSAAAYADDNCYCRVIMSYHNGTTTPLYYNAQPTIAVYTNGASVDTTATAVQTAPAPANYQACPACQGQLGMQVTSNPHGQQLFLYRISPSM